MRTLEARLTAQTAYRECAVAPAPESLLGSPGCAPSVERGFSSEARRRSRSTLEGIAAALSRTTSSEALAHAARTLASSQADVSEAQRLLALGAVEQALARARGDASLLIEALEHTERAFAAEPEVEAAWFNRALIAGEVGLCRVARSRWQDFRARFPDSPWVEEARRRELGLPCQAAGPKPVDALTEALERHLPAWLAAVDSDPVRAGEILEGLRETGAILAQRGDLGLQDLVRELQRADPGRRATFRAYVRGQAAFRNEAYRNAASELERSLPVLRNSRSVLHPWCEIWRAGIALHAGRFAQARQHLAEARRTPVSERSARTRGRLLWAEGLVDLREGRLESAHARFGDAERAFAEGGDRVDEASVRTLTAESLQRIGLLRESWHSRILAMRGLQGPRPPFTFHNALVDGAELAAAAGADRVADAFLEEGAALAGESGIENSRIEVLLWRGDVLRQRGESAGAAYSYGSALQAVRGKKEMDDDIRGRFEARARRGLASTSVDRDRTAGADLSASLAYFQAKGPPVDEVRTLREMAEHLRRKGEMDAANRVLLEAIEVLRRMRREVRNERLQVEFVDSVQEVFDVALELALQQERPLEALDLLEQARGLEAGDEPATGSLVEQYLVAHALSGPRSPVVVVYALAGSSFAWWTIDRGELRHGTRGAAPVKRAARALLDRLGDGRSVQDADLRELSELLLQEPLRGVADGRPLIFVPDRELQRIPFAALRNFPSRVRLIETRAISLRPDLSSAIAPRIPRKPGPPRADWAVLAIGNPDFDRLRFATLGRLPGAGREAARIAGLYGRNAVLLQDEAATPNAARDALVGRQVLHLAAHSEAGSDPFRDAFVLAPAPGSSGLVTSRELVPDTSSLQVVVLSACNTMGGRTSRAGSLVGLARPFIARQVPATVGTLWDVDDGLLGDLMVDFHRHLRGGLAASEALRQAQLKFLHIQPNASSLDWAAVEIVGDLPPEEVESEL